MREVKRDHHWKNITKRPEKKIQGAKERYYRDPESWRQYRKRNIRKILSQKKIWKKKYRQNPETKRKYEKSKHEESHEPKREYKKSKYEGNPKLKGENEKKKNEKNLELKQEYEKKNKYWESPETKREDRKMHKKKKKFK